MKRKALIAVGAAITLVAAFLGGRYSRAARVETRTEYRDRVVTQVEYRDRIVTQKGPVRIVTITRTAPSGETSTERTVERGPVTVTQDSTGTATATTETTSATRTVQDGGRPGWAASVSAAWDPRALSLSPAGYGIELDRRLVGTVWLGARADADDFRGTGLRLGLALRMEW